MGVYKDWSCLKECTRSLSNWVSPFCSIFLSLEWFCVFKWNAGMHRYLQWLASEGCSIMVQRSIWIRSDLKVCHIFNILTVIVITYDILSFLSLILEWLVMLCKILIQECISVCFQFFGTNWFHFHNSSILLLTGNWKLKVDWDLVLW